MMAMTRSASMTPSSMSLASSEASATLWIGTLRTSMGSGTVVHPSGWWCCDDAALTAAAHEAQRRLDLGPHGAGGEVALRGVLLHLAEGDLPDGAGVGAAVADDSVLDVGGDDQGVRLDRTREDGRGQVLVDDGLDAADLALLGADHGDAAAAGRHDDVAGVHE